MAASSSSTATGSSGIGNAETVARFHAAQEEGGQGSEDEGILDAIMSSMVAFLGLGSEEGEAQSVEQPAPQVPMRTMVEEARSLANPELWNLLLTRAPMSGEDRDALHAEQMAHSADTLSTDEIALVRVLIPEHLSLMGDLGCSEVEIQAEQAWCFELLSMRTAYLSQRNNDQGQGTNDVMCNLTTLANVLIHQGVRNPDPERQFEDVLEERLNEMKASEIEGVNQETPRNWWSNWELLASAMGLDLTGAINPGQATSSPAALEEFCLDTVRPILEQGGSVIAGLNQGKPSLSDTQASQKGHIVRVKWVQEDGVYIDDPYGRWADSSGNVQRWYWSESSQLYRILWDRNEEAQQGARQDVRSSDQDLGIGDPGKGADMFVNWEGAHQVNLFKSWMHTL